MGTWPGGTIPAVRAAAEDSVILMVAGLEVRRVSTKQTMAACQRVEKTFGIRGRDAENGCKARRRKTCYKD